MANSLPDPRGHPVLWLPGEFAICRLPGDAGLPEWAIAPGDFHSVTRTAGEFSVICRADRVPDGIQCACGWRLGRLEGTFPHDSTGVLASVIGPLAMIGVSVFACATFDTDYLLIRGEQVGAATHALRDAGHTVRGG